MFQKTTLKNGLRVITAPIQGSKTATVLILVGTGSKYETKENSGISHFLEHMFFKGTEKRPTPASIVEDLDKVGGEYNAFTSKEQTGYYAKVDPKHLGLALEWIADIFLNSKLEEEEVEKEKGVILEEINMYMDLPMHYVSHLWEELLYGDQPAGWPVWGDKKVIAGIKRQNFIDYLNSQYTGKNSLICIAGNFDEKNISGQIEKYFNDLRHNNFHDKEKVKDKQKKPGLLVHFKETDQTHLCLGVRGYNIFHPQRYAIGLLSTILGGFMSSRLFQEIREKRGLAYYIKTSSENNTDTGHLMTQAGVANAKAEEAVKAILEEYQKIKKEGASENELSRAKEYLKGNMLLNLETSDEMAAFIAGQEILKKEILTPEQVFVEIDKVEKNDIKRVAEDIFRPEKLNLALIGPFKEKNKFEKLLKF